MEKKQQNQLFYFTQLFYWEPYLAKNIETVSSQLSSFQYLEGFSLNIPVNDYAT